MKVRRHDRHGRHDMSVATAAQARLRRAAHQTSIAAICALGLVLSACGSAESQLEKYLERARGYASQGEHQKARIEYRNAIQIDDLNVAPRYELAQTLIALKQWKQAAGHLNRAIELDAEHIPSLVSLGRIFLLANQIDRATALVDRAASKDASAPGVLALRGALRARQGDDAGALADAGRAMALDPEDIEALTLAAHMEARADRVDAAIELLEQGLRMAPDNGPLRVLLSQTKRGDGDTAGAVAALSDGLERDPSARALRSRLAQLHLELEQEENAEQVIADGIALAPDDVELRIAQARLAQRLHGASQAQSKLKASIDALPQEWSLQLALAALYVDDGRREDAHRIYESLAANEDAGPSAIEARNRLAAAFAAQDNFDDALPLVTSVLEATPTNRDALTLRGTISLLKNDPAGAINDFRLVLANYPEANQVLRLRARAHLLNNEIDQAQRDLRTAIDADSRDVQSRLELVELLERYGGRSSAASQTTSKLLDETRAVADAMVQRDPRDAEAHMSLGSVALARGEVSSAIASLETALELNPTLQAAQRLLARALAVDEKFDRAIAIAGEAVASRPQDVRARLDLAAIALRSGDRRGAREAFGAVLEAAPNNAQALEALGRMDLEDEELGTALEHSKRLIAASPERPDGYHLAGQIHQRAGRVEESVAAYQAALENSPNAVEPLVALSRLYMTRGREAEAETLIRRRLETNARDVAALNQLGELLLKQGRSEEAEKAFEQAMALNPDWDVPHRNLGRARLARGDDEGALAALGGARQDAGSPALVYELAVLYERMKKPELAIEQYERFLERSPNSLGAANNLAVLLASYRSDEASLERARELVRPLTSRPEPAFLDTIGWVYFKSGDYERARQALERAVQGAPDEAEFKYHLGMVLNAQGDRDGARRHLEEATTDGTDFRGIGEARSTLESIRAG